MLDKTDALSETTKVAPYRVNPSAGSHNGEVSMQWMSRPADQRFTSLDALYAFKRQFWDGSFQTRANTKDDVELIAPEIKTKADFHKLTVGLKTLEGDVQKVREVSPTNFAFGQLCSLAKSPASWLREMPSPIVCDALNYRLKFARENEYIKLYGGDAELYAATGPDYGRIPDYEVVEAVRQVAGSGRGEMRWKIPGVMNWQTSMYDPEAPVTGESTTLYASDRDVFMFLVDDRNPIEVGKLANGDPDLMFRGFFIQNSEMGARALKLSAFYLRAVCMNRNLWGVENFNEITVRHNRLAPDRWLQQCQPALTAYANGSDTKLIDGVKAAKEAQVASNDEAAIEFLTSRSFSRTKAQEILDIGFKEEQRPVRSAWDMAQAITANARSALNTDDRLADELAAKKVLDAVA